MDKTTNRLKALLTAVALGVCCVYAQTASPGGFVLPNADPDADPYDFRMSKTDDGMSVSLTLNRIDRTVTDSVAGTCRVSVPGLSSTAFAGLPALPYKAFRIAPEGSGTPQIIVRDSTYIDIPVNLDHNPRIEYDSIGQPRQIAVARVDYSGFMPSDLARVTDTQTYRDRPIYTITVMPMKYDRATGVLRVFTSLDIDIAYTVQAQTQSAAGVTRSAAFNAYTDRMLTETLGEQAVAFSADRQVATMGIIDAPIGDKEPAVEIDLYDTTEDMLVISYKTRDTSFTAATDSLKEWKKNLGYRVHVVERGDWTQARVDSTIRHHYLFDKNLTTVIIMGIDTIVPGYSIQKRYPSSDSFYWKDVKDSTTDYPYMCRDKNDDYLPDVAYGRIPVYCTSQANEVVEKIIKYERGQYSRSDIYNKAFLATKYWSKSVVDNGRFIPTLEDIYTILENRGKTVQRIYATDPGADPQLWIYDYPYYPITTMPSYLLRPQFAWDGTKQDVKNAFEAGVNLAIYNGHGGNSSWEGVNFTDEDCRQLSFNDSAPLIMSIACSTANHKYNNCIVAELSRRMSGGIAVIASSNVTKLGYSDALLLGMIDAIYPNYTNGEFYNKKAYRLYDILNYGLLKSETYDSGGYWSYYNFGNKTDSIMLRYQREAFHVYGDPSLKYNTEKPIPFTEVACMPSLNKMRVELTDVDYPARIVVKNCRTGKIVTHDVGFESPRDAFDFPISKTDTMEVIVSAANRIPYHEIVTRHLPLSVPKGTITNVTYNSSAQTAVVTYTINVLGGAPSFIVTNYSNMTYNVPIAIGPGENQQTLYLSNVPDDAFLITLLVNGEVANTYKFQR